MMQVIKNWLCLRFEPMTLSSFKTWLNDPNKYGRVTVISPGAAQQVGRIPDGYLNWAIREIQNAEAVNLTLDSELQSLNQLDFPNAIQSLSIRESGAKISNRDIEAISVGLLTDKIEISNCRIGTLSLAQSPRALHIVDSSIGTLNFSSCPANPLILERTTVLRFALSGGPPTTGNVAFRKVFIPRNAATSAADIQNLRTLRKNLSDNQNLLAAGVLRSVELAYERHLEHVPAQVVSYIYEIGADFGNSISRPFWWALTSLVLSFLYSYLGNNIALGVPPADLHGWQTSLQETGHSSELLKSIVYAVQSIFNPLGIFSSRALLVTNDVFAGAVLTTIGLIGTLSLVLLLIAVRRRFKAEW